MKNINFFLLVMTILTSPIITYSDTFDELINSYDYNITSNNINIINISLINCTNCKNLSINLSITADIGDYEIYGFLDNKTFSTDIHFFEENNTVTLTFYPPFYNNISELYLKIINENRVVYFSNVSTINSSSFLFNSVIINVLNDSEFEEKILITINVENIAEGNYLIRGYLKNANETFTSTQTTSLNTSNNLTFFFNPASDGEFTLITLELNNSLYLLDYKTKNYSLSKIRFLSDYINNGNLIINITIKTNANSSFLLFDEYFTFIVLGSLINNTIIFNGSTINESKLNGPYIIKSIIESHEYTYTTSYYNHTDFYNNFEDKEIKTSIAKSIATSISSIGKNALGSVTKLFIDNKTLEILINQNSTNNSQFITSNKNNDGFMQESYLIESFNEKNNEFNNNNFEKNIIENLLTGNVIFNSELKNKSKPLILLALISVICIVSISSYLLIKRIRLN